MSASSLLWIGIVVAAFPLFAQQQPIPAPPAAPVNADSRITLDVVANDKSGSPIANLSQQDFTVLDNKQPQKIISFQALGQTSTDSGVEIVLVVDAVNTSFTRVAYVREELDKFLRQENGKLAWPVSIAILLDSGLQMQNEPSRDGNALAALLDGRTTGLRTLTRSQGFYGAVERSQLSFRALEQLAAQEEKRPGRKLVIWISPGWPLLSGPAVNLSSKDQQNIFNSVVEISTQLRHSRMAVYMVDPLGAEDSIRTFYYEQFLKPVTAPKQAQFGNLALQVFAIHSGGRVLTSNSDIAGQIERCVHDANTYYALSFEPPASEPGPYHAIEVKLSQKQLKAQTLSGYYGQPATNTHALNR